MKSFSPPPTAAPTNRACCGITTLDSLAIGQKARISALNLPPEHRSRLFEMGLTEGVSVQVVRFAPLGDPIEVKVRGYHLSLRKREAAGIQIIPE